MKPELPRDARLAKVSREARYTFVLLITQADDQGYFIATPRTLLGALYPHDPDVTERVLITELDSLRCKGLLEVFDTDDGPVGRIVNFMRHQKIDHPGKPFLATLSRKPREAFANGVLSLESGVLSPEQDKDSVALTGDPRGQIEPDWGMDAPPVPTETLPATMPAKDGKWAVAEVEGRIAKALATATVGQRKALSVQERRQLLGTWAVKYHLMNAKLRMAVYGKHVLLAVRILQDVGDDLGMLFYASDHMCRTPHNLGDNDRGTKYLSPELLFRNPDKFHLHTDGYDPSVPHPAMAEVQAALRTAFPEGEL